MIKIIFVDDEPRILEGLQRMLRPMRQEWSMRFAASGAQALDLLTAESADVVVTDMRMPGMDGGQLLSEVRRLHPRTVRIILTGESGRDAVLRSVRVAQRQLTKPCTIDSLKANIQQACALRASLEDKDVLAVVSQLESVPSLPAHYLEIETELESPDCSIEKVGGIISRDMGMACKILQVANSSFFGLQNQAHSLERAIVLLGLETIHSLVLGAQVFSAFDKVLLGKLSMESLWLHSQTTSSLARQIAKAERADKRVIELAGMAGLLHDIGKLVLAQWKPDLYRQVLTRADEAGRPVYEAEREVFGTTHAEVGACLLGLWGLPDLVVEAVLGHHRPSQWQSSCFSPLTAVHVANLMAHGGDVLVPNTCQPCLDLTHLEHLGLTARLPAWSELTHGLAAEGLLP
jgi:putative nucleotidyltransferase with HDIG domain